jgi:superfamily II DNA/RNA helicase
LLKEKELDSVIIFASTKSKVKSLLSDLRRAKLNAFAIHSDLEQAERETVMLDFRNRKFPFWWLPIMFRGASISIILV